jgi:hypothetical protein
MSESLKYQKYLVVRSFLVPSLCSFAYSCMLSKAESGHLNDRDRQDPCSLFACGDALMEMLMEKILPQMALATKLSLLPTYSFV